jgi:two-component system OmpR family response regulator
MSTILFIDDDADYAMMLNALLRLHGYVVITAQDGLEGVRKAREVQPDLILLDYYLPPTGGMSVVKELKGRSRTGKIPVVVMSALPVSHSQQLVQEADIKDFISKPFRVEDLIGTIRKYLTSRGELQASVSAP